MVTFVSVTIDCVLMLAISHLCLVVIIGSEVNFWIYLYCMGDFVSFALWFMFPFGLPL